MSKLIAWNTIKWNKIQKRVFKYQTRIYNASLKGNIGQMRNIQKRLVHSLDAKLLSVRRVTTDTKGKNPEGIERQLYTTSLEKSKLVRGLRIDGNAPPLKKCIHRVWITKSGKKEKRPLFSQPIIRDQAKQILLLLALEPEWEARFEENSYGFRPGRCYQDAAEAIFNSIRNTGSYDTHKYVLDANIKGCFDNINHDYLLKKLNTLPEFERQLKSWLKAGIFEGFTKTDNYESVYHTNQGGVISPFLANVTLHGLENNLKDWIDKKLNFNSRRGSDAKRSALCVIRYADDFVVIHSNDKIIHEAKLVISDWLKKTSGLELNLDKTKIINVNNGFNFLGFRFMSVKRRGITRAKVYPTREAVKRISDKVRLIIQYNKATSAYELIKKLRPVILEWANYYKYVECSDAFSCIDHLIYQKLRAWAFRRDRRNGRIAIKEKYFPSNREYTFDNTVHKNNWVLVGNAFTPDGMKDEVFLPQLRWIKSKKFVKIRSGASLYDGDTKYWIYRIQYFKNQLLKDYYF